MRYQLGPFPFPRQTEGAETQDMSTLGSCSLEWQLSKEKNIGLVVCKEAKRKIRNPQEADASRRCICVEPWVNKQQHE